eukprot:CAMPEP_0195523538 /NCGR_PEP_ID=MMETSP0794_2-20130614/22811_1 /TAXON_ID=515487 /ORGANISM="Stephanopyxis turris, Strain CCMP 815" /LENGTH=164 /DNA_ID=CAMNT_0040653559 /DNA_START=66 /DNA_END=560 /DNA_ORIENTATION=-
MKLISAIQGAAALVAVAVYGTVASGAGCEVDIGETTLAIGNAAAHMKNATFNCGKDGTPANCRADVANIESELSTASSHASDATTDCSDKGDACEAALTNLTNTLTAANKHIEDTGKACAFHGDPLCAIALVESSLSIAAGVVDGATALGDCKGDNSTKVLYLK